MGIVRPLAQVCSVLYKTICRFRCCAKQGRSETVSLKRFVRIIRNKYIYCSCCPITFSFLSICPSAFSDFARSRSFSTVFLFFGHGAVSLFFFFWRNTMQFGRKLFTGTKPKESYPGARRTVVCPREYPGTPLPFHGRYSPPVPAERRETTFSWDLIADRPAKRFRTTRKVPGVPSQHSWDFLRLIALFRRRPGLFFPFYHPVADSSTTSPRSRSFSIVLRLVITSCSTAYRSAFSDPTTTNNFLARENPV